MVGERIEKSVWIREFAPIRSAFEIEVESRFVERSGNFLGQCRLPALPRPGENYGWEMSQTLAQLKGCTARERFHIDGPSKILQPSKRFVRISKFRMPTVPAA
jgi:hypothetical protein